jgi:enoyl-CoA hydratase/carnithine racemase
VIWPHLVGPHAPRRCCLPAAYSPARKRRVLAWSTIACQRPTHGRGRRYAGWRRRHLAIRYTKIAINKLLWHSVNQIMDFSLMSEYVCMNTADHREATAAFREKRQPHFEGR